ncbi:uncharacterized protein Pyn_25253 [Prunus yedoensis var. nudiflora]|uniref:Uncharacterized protein n=1 Tax=Prunus yedoensis var. nudiflora TaxID=2094558 RepID=A0A314Y5A1_PRUYE|nr:uncharacterized protein Pyn_25253 [Prunus yedoensis var. nudiflora]
MMEHLSLVPEDQQPMSTSDDTTCNKMISHESDEWDFSVCDLNKKSLPTAIWWILCQNIDTWCTHASKKNLKKFLSLLIHTSLSRVRSSFGVVREYNNHAADRLKKVTLHQISSQCFIDSILYEQRFFCRYFASTFCRALEKSTLPLISDFSSGNFDFKSSPDWPSHFNSRAFSLYVTSILNLERLVVGGLLDYQNALYSHHYHELFRLFVSCRKALKYIILACEEKTADSQTSHTLLFFEDSFPILWLYKSVYAVVGLEESLPKDNFRPSNHAVHFSKVAELNAGLVHEHSSLGESDTCLDSSDYIEAWKIVTIIAKSLKEQMQSSLVNLKDALCNGKVGIGVDEFCSLLLPMLVCDSSQQSRTLCDAQNLQKSDLNVDLLGVLEGTDVETDIARVELHDESGAAMTASSDIHDYSGSGSVHRRRLHLEGANCVASALNDVDSFILQSLNRPLLRRLLNGDYPDATFLLRQLLIASSAILRLSLHMNSPPLSSSLMVF